MNDIVNQPPSLGPPTSKTNFTGNLGRKITNSKNTKDVHSIHAKSSVLGQKSSVGDNTTGTDENSKRKRKGVTNIDELDRILEADTQVLMNMKKDIHESQHQEVLKAEKSIAELKKMHDALYINNNMKEKQLKSYYDKIKTLEDVSNAANEVDDETNKALKSLNGQLEVVLENLTAENRTHKMICHMHERILKEISSSHIESVKLTEEVERVKHDLGNLNNTLRLSKQELGEEEKSYNQLLASSKSRKEQRDVKLIELQSIVEEGDKAVTLIHDSNNNSPFGKSSVFDSPDRSIGGGSPKTILSPIFKDKMLDTLRDIGDGNMTSLLTADQVSEIVNRYKSRSMRLEKLEEVDTELRDHMEMQKVRQTQLKEQLQIVALKLEQLSSGRQLYQEVDMKDNVLAAARKEFDEHKEREYRLRVNMASLKRALPRLLTKITKSYAPVPTDEQLPDAVHKLEDEVSKLLKTIDAAMLKDATSEDLATLSQQSTEGLSEIARLQQLPGYAKIKRALFYNLMSARPDTSDQNVRCIPSDTRKNNDYGEGLYVPVPPQLKKYGQHEKSSQDFRDFNIVGNSSQPLDRDLIKNISKLIIERDGKGKVPPHLLAKEKEIKKKFVPKFIEIK